MMYTLHGGNYRGVTWFEEVVPLYLGMDEGVVWLCAGGLHRAAEKDDLYERATRLGHQLLPTKLDEDRLALDQAYRFAWALEEGVPTLLQQAIDRPGETVAAKIGGQVNLSITLVVVERLQERTLVIDPWIGPGKRITPTDEAQILSLVFPGVPLTELEYPTYKDEPPSGIRVYRHLKES